jgi:hypothetical protein
VRCHDGRHARPHNDTASSARQLTWARLFRGDDQIAGSWGALRRDCGSDELNATGGWLSVAGGRQRTDRCRCRWSAVGHGRGWPAVTGLADRAACHPTPSPPARHRAPDRGDAGRYRAYARAIATRSREPRPSSTPGYMHRPAARFGPGARARAPVPATPRCGRSAADVHSELLRAPRRPFRIVRTWADHGQARPEAVGPGFLTDPVSRIRHRCRHRAQSARKRPNNRVPLLKVLKVLSFGLILCIPASPIRD